MPILTGKTIGQLTQLTSAKEDMLFAVEYTGSTYHIPYSSITQSFGNKWLIPSGDTVTVESNYQYFIYGDLIVEGTLILETNSQLVVVNGDIINSGGTITNNGTISNIEIPLFDTQVTGGTYSAGTITFTNNSGGTFTVTGLTTSFTGNTFGDCIIDLYVDNLYGCSLITIHDSLQSTGSTASGILSIAFGFNNQSTGDYSHAEGKYTISSGFCSHSEGQYTLSFGDFSHSEGENTNSYGEGSHSEGYENDSIGVFSHVEGTSNKSGAKVFTTNSIVSGLISFNFPTDITSEFNSGNVLLYTPTPYPTFGGVFGVSGSTYYNSGTTTFYIQLNDTSINNSYPTYFVDFDNLNSPFAQTTIGNYSHSEGRQTISLGGVSHSEGYKTISFGDYSHTEGVGTISLGNYQHVSGKFNSYTGLTTEGAFIIGNGTNNSNRSNLFSAAGNEVNISGKTITTNFQMTSGATTAGYVLVDSDGTGNAQWKSITGITGVVNKYTTTLINPSGGTHTITHNLGTPDISVSLYLMMTDDVAVAQISNRTTNSVNVNFSVPPSEDIRVVIIG